MVIDCPIQEREIYPANPRGLLYYARGRTEIKNDGHLITLML